MATIRNLHPSTKIISQRVNRENQLRVIEKYKNLQPVTKTKVFDPSFDEPIKAKA